MNRVMLCIILDVKEVSNVMPQDAATNVEVQKKENFTIVVLLLMNITVE